MTDRLGDFTLNEIYQGNCLELMRGLPDKCVDLVLTDPPYLVNFQSNRRIIKHNRIVGDNDSTWIDEAFSSIYRVLKDNSLCISFYGWPAMEEFGRAWRLAGFKPKSHFAYVKSNIGLGWFSRGQHEPAILLAKGKPQRPRLAISDVIYADVTGNDLHPTQKDDDAIARMMQPFIGDDFIIFDPFSGSGTTLVAAKQLGLQYIGFELSADYVRIAKERLKQDVLAL